MVKCLFINRKKTIQITRFLIAMNTFLLDYSQPLMKLFQSMN